MTTLSACFNCAEEIPNRENYFYCMKCLAQIRCKVCSELIEKDAVGCSNCGTPITSVQISSGAINNIEFEQNGDKKKFVASFTDHIGESLVNTLGNLFLGTQPKGNMNPFGHNKNMTNLYPKKDLKFDDAEVVNFTEDSLNEGLNKIFKFDNDKVSLINTRLKQTGKLDHAIRISLLTLYAYSFIDKAQVQRNLLNEVLNHAKVYDGNFRVWIASCDEISKIENGDLLELSLPGISAAKEILSEFLDGNVEKGKVNFSSAKTKRKKKKKDDVSDEPSSLNNNKKNTSSKKSPLQNVEDLIQENYFSNKHTINEVANFLKDKKATVIATKALSTVFGRLINNGKIKREKNSDGQYEYYK